MFYVCVTFFFNSAPACFFPVRNNKYLSSLLSNYVITCTSLNPYLTSVDPKNVQLNCSVCCLNFSPEDVVTQSTKKYIDSESLKLESFSGVLFSTPKSSIVSNTYLHCMSPTEYISTLGW